MCLTPYYVVSVARVNHPSSSSLRHPERKSDLEAPHFCSSFHLVQNAPPLPLLLLCCRCLQVVGHERGWSATLFFLRSLTATSPGPRATNSHAGAIARWYLHAAGAKGGGGGRGLWDYDADADPASTIYKYNSRRLASVEITAASATFYALFGSFFFIPSTTINGGSVSRCSTVTRTAGNFLNKCFLGGGLEGDVAILCTAAISNSALENWISLFFARMPNNHWSFF